MLREEFPPSAHKVFCGCLGLECVFFALWCSMDVRDWEIISVLISRFWALLCNCFSFLDQSNFLKLLPAVSVSQLLSIWENNCVIFFILLSSDNSSVSHTNITLFLCSSFVHYVDTWFAKILNSWFSPMKDSCFIITTFVHLFMRSVLPSQIFLWQTFYMNLVY